ncbi:MAG: hypothetical protein WCT53_04980 [Candidatus Gracilibacteria bacterium]
MKNFLKKLAEKIKKSCKAETLLEVIVATTVLMTVIVPASSLYISNIKSSALNKNDLIGASLAEEALEMMKNIRDTNLLKFSAKTDANGNNICWNAKPNPVLNINDALPANYCGNPANQIVAGSYRIDIDTSDPQLPIQLSAPQVPALNPDSLTITYALVLDALDEKTLESPCTALGTPMDNCHNHFQHDTHVYIYGTNPPFSPFYRELKVDRLLDLDGVAATNEGMQVTATVVYMSGSTPRIIKRTMILTNRAPSL